MNIYNLETVKRILSISRVGGYTFRKATEILTGEGYRYRICYKTYKIHSQINGVDFVVLCGVDVSGSNFCTTILSGETPRDHNEPYDFRIYLLSLKTSLPESVNRLGFTQSRQRSSIDNISYAQLTGILFAHKTLNDMRCSCPECGQAPLLEIGSVGERLASIVLTALKTRYS
jgi:hypothetical protein